MAIVEVTIIPIGTETPSISNYVAACHKVLKETDLKYQLTPMGTIIEGELKAILKCIEDMHEVPFNNGAMRVATTIKIDDRRDRTTTMENKMKSVHEKLL
ncbi:MTH1187 family thiamine-binding protein [Serpentinicella sp. ANB-PHB4]|uniref:MTH1187 family thiamine-binding protein n=1 Tax=Serpentinicella sp. ANB-PHB4 TaxID=3074076 RepID=UPI00286017DD|nr:MTH1187 family thiamine-binding protein [Serpentinicella sp. ANB-PHB4]MDR5659035.1 MTH1187 family thiamine-binding protein [Serpentinicella sp. ANB-PHB4]